MVCEWMTNGNISRYLKQNPAANRLDLVTLFSTVHPACLRSSRQLMDIAKGLQFLHSIGVLHGDLKGA